MSRTRHDAQRIPSGSHSHKASLRKHYKRKLRYSHGWENWDEYQHPVIIHTIYQAHYW